MPNLSGVESEISPQGFEVIARELTFETLDGPMAPNKVVRVNDFCLAISSDQASRDVKGDGGSFLAADLNGCAGVKAAAVELVEHLLEPIRAVALDVARAMSRCRA